MNNKVLFFKRCERFIKNSIEHFSLDLSNLVVYTELGSGNYVFSPIISFLAGAKKVYAFSCDSRYGSFKSNVNGFYDVVNNLGLDGIKDKVVIVDKKKREDVVAADIVTNSGLVRPINRFFVSMMKETAVIPLMFEAWEFRPEDVDIDFCRSKDIMVLGVNEECSLLDVMRYSGFLVCKLMFECGFGVHKDNVLLIGSGRIGHNIARFLSVNKIDFYWFSLDDDKHLGVDLSLFDVIVVAEHYHNVLVIGRGGLIDPDVLFSVNPLVQIVHICGNVDVDDILRNNLSIHPVFVKPFGYMSVSMDYVCFKSSFELFIAGLRVGEIMARNRIKFNSFKDAYDESVKDVLVDGNYKKENIR